MKHAGDVYFCGGPNMPPAERVCVGKVWMQLPRANPAFTSIIEDCGEEKNSQELFELCLAQD
jgi:hypothetical protein